MLLFGLFLLLSANLAAAQNGTRSLQPQLCILKGRVQILGIPMENENIKGNCSVYDDDDEIDIGYAFLEGKSIRGFKRGWWRSSKSLRVIAVSHNKIRKRIFDHIPKTINKILMRHNKILRLKRIRSNYNNLTWLDLSYNPMLAIMSRALEKLPHLEVLHLAGNQLTNLEFAATLPSNIEWLNLSYNAITKIPDRSFASLPNLKILDLSFNNIIMFGNQLSQDIQDMRYVDFSHNPITNHRVFSIDRRTTTTSRPVQHYFPRPFYSHG